MSDIRSYSCVTRQGSSVLASEKLLKGTIRIKSRKRQYVARDSAAWDDRAAKDRLCSACYRIFQCVEVEEGSDEWYTHHFHTSQLLRAAKRGCFICSSFATEFKRSSRVTKHAVNVDGGTVWQLSGLRAPYVLNGKLKIAWGVEDRSLFGSTIHVTFHIDDYNCMPDRTRRSEAVIADTSKTSDLCNLHVCRPAGPYHLLRCNRLSSGYRLA
jgi:hypothetical protein